MGIDLRAVSVMRDYRILRRVPGPNRELYLAEKGEGDARREFVLAVLGRLGPDTRRRLEDDVGRAQRLTHATHVSIVDVFEHDGQTVVVTECVEGMSLHRLMRYLEENEEPLGDAAILYLGCTLLECLSEAHGLRIDGRPRPVVHGQCGPHQVLLSWDGDVRLLGLGMGPVLRNVEAPRWLRDYQAPERRRGSAATPRSNAFATAAMLWSLFARRPVPRDGVFAPLRDLRPDLQRGIAGPLDDALAKAPLQRPSCKMLAMALSREADAADREELRWALEVCRVRCTVEEEFFPTASFPPTVSDRPPGSAPPNSDETETERYDQRDLLAKARLFGPLPWEREPHSSEGAREGEAEPGARETDRDDDDRPSATRTKRNRRPRSSRAAGLRRGSARAAPPRPGRGRSERPPSKAPASAGTPVEGAAATDESRAVAAPTKSAPPRARADVRLPAENDDDDDDAAAPACEPGPPRPRRPTEDHLTLRAPPHRVPDAHEVAPPPPLHPRGTVDEPGAEGAPAYRDPATPVGHPAARVPPDPNLPGGPSAGSAPVSHHPASYYPPGLVPVAYYPPGYVPPGSQWPPATLAAGPSSEHAPPSQRHDATGPGGGVIPSHAYVPFPVPGTLPAPGTLAPGAPAGGRWWVGAIAVTAIVSFVLGVIIASGSIIEVNVGNRDAPAGSSPPEPKAAPVAAATEDTAKAPSAAAVVDGAEVSPPSGAPQGAAEAAPTGDPPSAPPKALPAPSAPLPTEGRPPVAELAPGRGWFRVAGPFPNAVVYVQGTQTGPLGEWFAADCGVKFVRLGSRPLRVWYAGGRAVDIACGGHTDVTFKAGPPSPVTQGRPRKSRFLR